MPARVWMLVRSRILALLLVLAIIPSGMELVELAVHIVRYGDVAHADQHDKSTKPIGSDEHGCSGTFHLCSCHQVVSATTPLATTVVCLRAPGESLAVIFPLDRTGEAAQAPPVRPPIA